MGQSSISSTTRILTGVGLVLVVTAAAALVSGPVASQTKTTGTKGAYGCLDPRAPGKPGRPWLSAKRGLSYQTPPGSLLAKVSSGEAQLSASFAAALGTNFSSYYVKDWATSKCQTEWNIQYANSAGSTATIWVFQADEVISDDFVINTFEMSAKTTPKNWQVLTQDTEGYLDYAVTATANGLVVVVSSQGVNSGWLISGWPTTTSSEPEGPTPDPEPITLSALRKLDATMTRDSLSELSGGRLELGNSQAFHYDGQLRR